MKKTLQKEKVSRSLLKSFFWFTVGASLGIFLVMSFVFLLFQKAYEGKVYPGVFIEGVDFGGKKTEEVKQYFDEKNKSIPNTTFVFESPQISTKISAKKLGFGYNSELLAQQSYSIGRSKYILSDIYLVFQAYMRGVTLEPSYSYSEEELEKFLNPSFEKLKIPPIDALFTFEDGRVVAFRPSSNGQELDFKHLKQEVSSKTLAVMSSEKPQTMSILLPVKIIEPNITTDKANNLGIRELVGEGTSLFQGSIPNRVFNITLASTRLNGLLIKPGEVFSFDQALGDVSAFTGYQQAYVIRDGRTVLGDGGGVCQVSTTFFRAALNAGLPIIERTAHAYRVGYYEQDSPPGLDATIYVPSVDLKVKNDTENYILIQASVDPVYYRLTFQFYGTRDARVVKMGKPVITRQTPAPEPLYQDDPNMPRGQLKQVDFAAAGANVYFTREVKKDGKVIISDKFVSNFRPWQAVFLRGTGE